MVGICSYLLVCFWFTRIAANQSSLSALLTNRVGDCFLTIGMFAILWSFGNLDYATVFSLAPFVNENIITIIGICLLIGAMAKSSQVGLHVWLPMAMEGLVKRAFLKLHYMREHPIILRSTSYYVTIGKILSIGQSAGNQLMNTLGFSETTREAITLDTFKWWFIGFAEGDGHFGIDKRGYLVFKITQSSLDAQVLFYIKKSLGFGSVSLQSSINKTHQFRVRDKNSLIQIINIFNGNLITKAKILQFKLFLQAFNTKYNTNIEFSEQNNTNKVSLDNAWLSGFTDAEGCFTCSAFLNKTTNKHIVTVRYIISPKNDIEFSNNLANLINGYVSYLKSYDGYNTVVNSTKLSRIIKYINNFPLQTKKHISYIKWLKVHKLVMDKQHLTGKGIDKIKLLIRGVNSFIHK